jgi:hypothetical protein
MSDLLREVYTYLVTYENYACGAFGSKYIIRILFSTLSSGVIDFVIGSKMAAWQPI